MGCLSCRRAWYIPLVQLVAGSLTLVSCYITALYITDHVPHVWWCPFISLLGAKYPEHYIYAVGFTIMGLLILWSIIMLHMQILRRLCGFKIRSWIAVIVGVIGVLGELVQAIIPLKVTYIDEDTIRVDQWDRWSQSHQAGAGVFFFCSLIHAFIVTYIFFCHARARIPMPTKSVRVSRNFKLLCVVAVMASIAAAFLFHPASGGDMTNKEELLFGSVCQWVLAMCCILFFASYSYDLYHASHARDIDVSQMRGGVEVSEVQIDDVDSAPQQGNYGNYANYD